MEALRKPWSFLEALDLPTDDVRDRSKVFVCDVETENGQRSCFVKIYANRLHPFQRWMRQSRSQNETRNLCFFREVGIPTPEIVAWGQRRNWMGRIVQEFIITAAEADTVQLDDFTRLNCPTPNDASEIRQRIASQLGGWTRSMHDNGFIHEDLKWRNILARLSGNEVELFWIDCPKGKFYPQGSALERKKLKDCATLDKIARIQCSKQERRLFIQAYLGDDANESDQQQLCQRIERYRSQRFDPKDDKQRDNAKENHQD